MMIALTSVKTCSMYCSAKAGNVKEYFVEKVCTDQCELISDKSDSAHPDDGGPHGADHGAPLLSVKIVLPQRLIGEGSSRSDCHVRGQPRRSIALIFQSVPTVTLC